MPTLLVIDMQEDFVGHPALEPRRAALVRAINELAGAFRRAHEPVVWIRQLFEPDLSDAYLEMRRQKLSVVLRGTPGAEILAELSVGPDDRIVTKKRYSAFFGTELEDLLAEAGRRPLVVAGVNTHACVRMTVIDAYQRDLEVVVARDGIASNDPDHGEVTERYLDGKMATFLSNTDILSALETGRWAN